MELLLQNEGYRVKSANSGTEGIAEVEKQAPDLIILDLMMPDISGLEVVRHLKSQRHVCDIPIILLTANANFQPKEVRDLEAICYKPFNLDSILKEIESILALNFQIAV